MRHLIPAIVCLALTQPCLAQENPERQAESFARIYKSFCLQHIDDLDALKGQLESVPPLAPRGAEIFLNGMPGGAWPVPDIEGTYVLALPKDENMCVVFGRRANAAKVEELFVDLVSAPPGPLLVRKIGDAFEKTPKNGTAHNFQYEWYTEYSSRKIVLNLSTSSFEEAEIQVVGSISVVDE